MDEGRKGGVWMDAWGRGFSGDDVRDAMSNAHNNKARRENKDDETPRPSLSFGFLCVLFFASIARPYMYTPTQTLVLPPDPPRQTVSRYFFFFCCARFPSPFLVGGLPRRYMRARRFSRQISRSVLYPYHSLCAILVMSVSWDGGCWFGFGDWGAEGRYSMGADRAYA